MSTRSHCRSGAPMSQSGRLQDAREFGRWLRTSRRDRSRPRGTCLTVCLALAALIGCVGACVAAPDAGNPRAKAAVIGEIVVKGARVLNPSAIIALSGHKVGDVCDSDTLSDIRSRLAKTGNFGMHTLNDPLKGVSVSAADGGAGKCVVTITIDENDPVVAIEITGTGPVKVQEVHAQLTRSAVFSPPQFRQDLANIRDLYAKRGFTVDFADGAGMAPGRPCVLRVPLVVARVRKIDVLIDGFAVNDPELLQRLTTRTDGFFARKALYDEDKKRLLKEYAAVNLTDRPFTQGWYDIEIALTTKAK